MKTYSAKPLEIERKWYVIDAEGEILGRLATRVANILRGKNKPRDRQVRHRHAGRGQRLHRLRQDRLRRDQRRQDQGHQRLVHRLPL